MSHTTSLNMSPVMPPAVTSRGGYHQKMSQAGGGYVQGVGGMSGGVATTV